MALGLTWNEELAHLFVDGSCQHQAHPFSSGSVVRVHSHAEFGGSMLVVAMLQDLSVS